MKYAALLSIVLGVLLVASVVLAIAESGDA